MDLNTINIPRQEFEHERIAKEQEHRLRNLFPKGTSPSEQLSALVKLNTDANEQLKIANEQRDTASQQRDSINDKLIEANKTISELNAKVTELTPKPVPKWKRFIKWILLIIVFILGSLTDAFLGEYISNILAFIKGLF